MRDAYQEKWVLQQAMIKTGPEGSRGPVKKKILRRRWGAIGHTAIASHVIIGHRCDLIRAPPGSDRLNPFYLSLFWMSLFLMSGLYVPTVEGDVTLWMQCVSVRESA